YQANKPILDKLLKEAGFDGDDAISSLLGNLDGAKPARPATAAAPAKPATPAAAPTQTIIPPAPKPAPKKD
ncbi:flotillin family protein, partial [Rhizobium ruizarguesonis]